MPADISKLADRVTGEFDAIVVGAGFGGLYALYRLRKDGYRVKVLEAAADVGGTWYFNRYPGARCDIESMSYSYSFSDELQQEWEWSERYAAQPEILKYINHVADRFDLRPQIQFDTRVMRVLYDDTEGRWLIETEAGEVFAARFCVLAAGCLSVPQKPDVKGLDSFKGNWYHTGFWPHEMVDFTGQRVGVIGTGSSGIQAIPIIAEQARHLTVFQRTPNYSIPAWNRPLEPDLVAEWKARYAEIRERARTGQAGVGFEPRVCAAMEISREEQLHELKRRWQHGGLVMWETFTDVLSDERANAVAADFVREKIRAVVEDPEVADLLCPKGYPYGAKRICVDTNYYRTFNRDNVTLVDIAADPIEEVTPSGLRTRDREFELDALVFATGFDAMTGPILKIDIRGKGGVSLRDKWSDGPHTYLGLMVAGFPNMFIVAGPGSPSVLSNMVVSIEQHVDWIADCLATMKAKGNGWVEPTQEAEDEWTNHCNQRASETLFPQANSWYMGANIPGKPRVFMPYLGGVGAYREICDDVAAKDYDGFAMSAQG
jgi:cyclohexanone monooxygenase